MDGISKPTEHLLAGISSAPGDEWEYVSKDTFGKQQKLVGRVKAVVPGTGVLESYSVDGKEFGEWVFDGKPSMLGAPIDASLLFSPHWSGNAIETLSALNGSKCGLAWNCSFIAKIAGNEKITVPAGTFDTRKIELHVAVGSPGQNLEIVVWYSVDQKRLVRQTVKGRGSHPNHAINSVREMIELSAFRPGVR